MQRAVSSMHENCSEICECLIVSSRTVSKKLEKCGMRVHGSLFAGMTTPGSPLLLHQWSAATLLSAVKAMESDAQIDVLGDLDAQLPDDPAELQKLVEARHPILP